MIRKLLVLAAIVLGCLLGVAAAQNMGLRTASQAGAEQPRAAEQLRAGEALRILHALAQQHARTPGYKVGAPATGSRASTIDPSTAPGFPVGVNFVHATNCGWFVDGAGNQFFFVLPLEGGVVFEANNENAAHGLMVPCVNGNLFAFNVVDSAGDFNFTQSFPF